MSLPNRAALPVLVSDSHAFGALAVIRSLGRAGYPVHAVTSADFSLGSRSAYASHRVRCPDSSSPQFIPWLRGYVQQHGIRAIVPSEGVLLALRRDFAEFSPLLPYSGQPNVVFRALSKFDTAQALMASGFADRLPPTLFVRLDDRLPDKGELAAIPLPAFVKVDGIYSTDGQGGRVVKAESHAAALDALERLRRSYSRAIVQGYVRGVGVGAFFLKWRGRLIAQFMHKRLHEVPHTGGASSLRESWFHAAINDNARAMLDRLDWEGVAMFEYRWDESADDFRLMELNARFWGSLHLALFAGVDFPTLLLDSFHGATCSTVDTYALKVRCRQSLSRELQYVWSLLKDADVRKTRKLAAVAEFLVLAVDPRVREDLAFPGDRHLRWLELRRFLAQTLSRTV